METEVAISRLGIQTGLFKSQSFCVLAYEVYYVRVCLCGKR